MRCLLYIFLFLFTNCVVGSDFLDKIGAQPIVKDSLKRDTVDKVKNNSINMELIGKHVILGFNYERRLLEKNNNLLKISLGFGYQGIHPFEVPAIIQYHRVFKSISIYVGVGIQITFGSDASFGYSSYVELQEANPDESGPPGTLYWYPSRVLNYTSEIGVRYRISESWFIGGTVNPVLENTYLGHSNRKYKIRGGVHLGVLF